MSFLGEIKRRKVFQVAAVYAVAAWLTIQIVDVVAGPLNLPDWFATFVIVLFAVGFPIAVILAWAFDVTPEGIKADAEVRGSSVHVEGQRLNHVLQSLVLVAVGFLIVQQYAFNPRTSPNQTSSPGTEVDRFDYDIPVGQSFRLEDRAVMDLSRDGRQFLYNTDDGVYLRAMSELEARLIPGTEPALSSPVFSPDGQFVAYHDIGDGQLKRIAISGGAPVPIAAVESNLYGISWAMDGTIFFGQPDGIYSVSATGGTPTRIIQDDDGMQVYGPQLLPDGDSLLFSVGSIADRDAAQVVVQSLSTSVRRVVVEGGNEARYLPTGHLIYALGDGLFALAFDLDSLTTSGGAVPLVRGVMRANAGQSGVANYSVSENGTLVYVSETAGSGLRSLAWVDREGREEAISVEADVYVYPRISPDPDGTRVALDGRNLSDNDIRVLNLATETMTRLTIGEGGGVYPVWTPPDGERIAYGSGAGGIYWKAANNTGTPVRLAMGGGNPFPLQPSFFSPSGTELIFRQSTGTGGDIGRISIGSDAEPVWLLREPADERNAELSPNGRWMAYESDESGKVEIYVRPYPDVNADIDLVSNAGGVTPLWSRDGRELFYLEPGSPARLMSVAIDANETDFSFNTRTQVLDWPYLGLDGVGRSYDVSPDGQRFLVIKADDQDDTAAQIVVVQNWSEELNRLVPVAE